MTLDPRPSDAELLARAREATYHAEQHANAAQNALAARIEHDAGERRRQRVATAEAVNGVALGPDSPLRKAKSLAAKKAVATRRENEQSEHADQCEIFRWASNEGATLEPLLATTLFYAVPNVGTFSEQIGARIKDEGRKKGVQDMSLDVARSGWHGLRIEQKANGQRPSQEQVEHAQLLTDQGYCHRFSYSPEYTKQVLLDYLAGAIGRHDTPRRRGA